MVETLRLGQKGGGGRRKSLFFGLGAVLCLGREKGGRFGIIGNGGKVCLGPFVHALLTGGLCVRAAAAVSRECPAGCLPIAASARRQGRVMIASIG